MSDEVDLPGSDGCRNDDLDEDGSLSTSSTSNSCYGEEELSTSGDNLTEDNSESNNDDHTPTETQSADADSSKSGSVQQATAAAAPTTAAAFSVAQALSMVRRRREEEQKAAEEKEQELKAQRLERAREKRRRRRRNQKLRKASTKLNEKADVAEDSLPSDHLAQNATLSEGDVGQSGDERPRLSDDSDCKRGADDENGESLKRLPMKKRIKLATSDPPSSPSIDTCNAERRTIDQASAHAKAATAANSACDSRLANGVPARSQIKRLIPRSLILKMSKVVPTTSKGAGK